MAKIISIVNQKGGVGKTTSAVNLASYLAAMGKYVLVVDIDPQGNATSGLGIEPERVPLNLYHTLVGGLLPEEVIKKTTLFGYDLIPAASDLAGANVELVPMTNREYKLYEVLRRIRTNYDYILVDCPPSLGLLTINGIVAADEIIIPVQCEYYALEGLGQLLRTIELVEENLGRKLPIKGALLTLYDRRNRLSRQVRKEMERNYPGRIFNAVIPRCVRLAEAPGFGKTIFQYDPRSSGAKAYRSLAEEIINIDSREESNIKL